MRVKGSSGWTRVEEEGRMPDIYARFGQYFCQK
jgi:hypothetical protein